MSTPSNMIVSGIFIGSFLQLGQLDNIPRSDLPYGHPHEARLA